MAKIVKSLIVPSQKNLAFSQEDIEKIEAFCNQGVKIGAPHIDLSRLLALRIDGNNELVSLTSNPLHISVNNFLQSLYAEVSIYEKKDDFGETITICKELNDLQKYRDTHLAYNFCSSLVEHKENFEERNMTPLFLFDGISLWFVTIGEVRIVRINATEFFVNNDSFVSNITDRLFL